MFDVLKTSNGLITLAFFVAIVASCFYSITLACLLILTFLGFKCWYFSRQSIIRYRPGLSIGILCPLIVFTNVLNVHVYQKEMQRGGCHIVSGVVKERYTTTSGRSRMKFIHYHTIVEYESRQGGLTTEDMTPFNVYNGSIEGQHIIIAEPLRIPGHFEALELNPSAAMVERMCHGVYCQGSLNHLETIQDDANIREKFVNYDKLGLFDFFKESPLVSSFIIAVLALSLTFYSDKTAFFSIFVGLSLVVLLSMLTNKDLSDIEYSFLIFYVALLLGEYLFLTIRVKNEIKRDGGFITVGDSYKMGSGKNQHMRVSFIDAMGNERSEVIFNISSEKKSIIIAHSMFNDVNIICLDDNPSKELLEEFKNGKFIGPCSEIDLNSVLVDDRVRSKYEKLYTPRVK